MSNLLYRVSTANQYDTALRNIGQRQTALSNLQENLTSGKRVVRASDDPVAAAQAERALNRLSRIQSEQRALETQRNAIALGESTLGDAVEVIQSFRQLVVQAGGGALTSTDRATIANQLQSLREQLQEVANRKDPNGIPLLSALGSAATPFPEALNSAIGNPFAGLAGQAAPGGVTLPGALDGHSAFAFDLERDGVYTASVARAPGSSLTTSAVTTSNRDLLDENTQYALVINSVVPDAVTGTTTVGYTLTKTAAGTPPTSTVTTATSAPVKTGQPVSITITEQRPAVPPAAPVSETVISLNLTGAPQAGDTVVLQPSLSLFNTLDSAINGIRNGGSATQTVGQALANIDAGLERIHNLRGYAGELLNRADRITGDQEKRSIQLEADRSRAEDLDMIKGISDFQNQQVGYDAALKSYAQVQKLSLFNYIG